MTSEAPCDSRRGGRSRLPKNAARGRLELLPGRAKLDAFEQAIVVGHGGLTVGERPVEVRAPHLTPLDEQSDDAVSRRVGQGFENPDCLRLKIAHIADALGCRSCRDGLFNTWLIIEM